MNAAHGLRLALWALLVTGCASTEIPRGSVGSSDFRDGAALDLQDGGRGGSPGHERLPEGSPSLRVDAGVVAPPDVVAPLPEDASASTPAVPRHDSGAADSRAPADASREGSDSGQRDPGDSLVRIQGWSVRKRARTPSGADVVLEEVLASFADPLPGQGRLVSRATDGAATHSWMAPHGALLSDICAHRSGEISAIFIAPDGSVSLQRLSPDLEPLATLVMHDPEIASDPHVTDAGALDLLANALAPDSARLGCADEAVVAAVTTSWNSVVAYRTSWVSGAWMAPQRTLIEPPVGLTPHLPIGGSFDTFGAMWVWYRPLLDVDEAGNAYIATWASPRRIGGHVTQFHDDLVPVPGDPNGPVAPDSDVLVTKMDPSGKRVWSRVVGTVHEDEPYAIRARAGAVAVVGRARRFAGFDNTFWDAFVSVVSSDGAPVGSRTLPLDASGILLAVDASPAGGWVLGGSNGWSQNPEGLSVVSYGSKLLAWLPAIDAPLQRIALAGGPRHNEIRTVLADTDHVRFGGHEDGPIMHTGDSDPSQIFATGVLGSVSPVSVP